MKRWLLTLTAALTLSAMAPALAQSALPRGETGAVTDQAEQYAGWLEQRMRLWPQEIILLERSPVASSQELDSLKEMMRQVQHQAELLNRGMTLAESPVQRQVLLIESELERLAGEADRLPILAGPTD